MNPTPLLHVEDALRNAVASGTIAGAALSCGSAGGCQHDLLVGYAQTHFETQQSPRRLEAATLFDLASLTKVLCTTWLCMKMHEDNRLDLDAPLGELLVGYYPPDKQALTVRQLMCHAAGLPSGLRLREQLEPDNASPAARRDVIEHFLQAPMSAAAGQRTLYSDIGPILVGDLLEQLHGSAAGRLDRICAEQIHGPLGLTRTFFRHLDDPMPVAQLPVDAFAATEDCPWRGRILCGEVHDENAHLLRGVAGHAGLFSTATDLAHIARAWLRCQSIGVQPRTRQRLTQVQAVAPDADRGFGWDRPRPGGPSGTGFSASAFGHTGFTGTSIWIDPELDRFVVLLTNRVHPTREDRGYLQLRPLVHDLVLQGLSP